jgi:hypothetical protein
MLAGKVSERGGAEIAIGNLNARIGTREAVDDRLDTRRLTELAPRMLESM